MLSLRSDVFIIITNNTKQTIYFGFINIRLTPIFCGFRSSVDPRIQLFIEVRLETYDKTLPTYSHIPETVNLILQQQKLNLMNLNEIISTYPLLLHPMFTCSIYLTCLGCPLGWYGPSCQLGCPAKCLDGVCDPDNGRCCRGCQDGYTGDLCNQSEKMSKLTERTFISNHLDRDL